ncbi:hypothetical protein D3C85_1335270 [compost metagenome]
MPDSPARAASTAAFSARMLVWNAMPSMMVTMSAILRELSEMPCMVLTTCPTATPPRRATSMLLAANWLACRALSAFWRTVDVSCSMLAAVCCNEAAWPSVRPASSWLPRAMCTAACVVPSMPR